MLQEDPHLAAQIKFEKLFDYDSFINKLLVQLNKDLVKQSFKPVALTDPFKAASYTVRLAFIVKNSKGIGSPIDKDIFNFMCNGPQAVKDVLMTLAMTSANQMFEMQLAKHEAARRQAMAGTLSLKGKAQN